MKKHLEDKLNMALAAQQAMNDNTSLWSSLSAAVTAMNSLATKIAGNNWKQSCCGCGWGDGEGGEPIGNRQ